MQKVVTLCGKCIVAMSDHYRVTESTGRKKITCESCGKRGYGGLCRVEDIPKKKG